MRISDWSSDVCSSDLPPQCPNVPDQSIALLRDREQETKLSLSAPLIAPELWANVDAKRALAGASRAQREAYARTLVSQLQGAYYGAIEAASADGRLEAREKLLAQHVRVPHDQTDQGKATHDRGTRKG